MTIPSYPMIGTTYESMARLDALTTKIPMPKMPMKPYAETRDTGSGLARGLGRPQLAWGFTLLTTAQRDQLRAFCAGMSAKVYVRTKTNENSDAYATYYATVLWPSDYEERDTGRRPEFVLTFRDLVLIPDPVEEE